MRLLFHKIGALEARTGGLHDAHGCAVDVMASDATSDARGKHGGARPPRSSRRRSDKAKQRQLSAFGFRLFCAGNVGVPVVPRAVPANLDGGAEQRAIDVERRHGIVAVPPWRNALWLQHQQQRDGAPIGDPAAGAGGGQTAAAGASGNGDTAVSQAASHAGDGVGPSAGGGNDGQAAAAADGGDESGPATIATARGAGSGSLTVAAAAIGGGGGSADVHTAGAVVIVAPTSESTPEQNLGAAREAVEHWHRKTNCAWDVFSAVACAVSPSHLDGVALQCLACPGFKGQGIAGQVRLYKFGPYGNNAAKGRYDTGFFVSTHLRTTKHRPSWAAFFARTMRVLPRGEALPSARPAAPLPLTHLDVMRHTHAKDFEITSSTWLCRRCGHQGAFKASTTPGSLLSHLSSARCNRLQPVRVAASRFAQFFVVSDSVKRRRAVELRFPRGAAVRIKQSDGTLRRASVLSTTATTVTAALDLVIIGDLQPPQSVV